MASQFDKLRDESKEELCLHPRLVLHVTTSGYLTGEYVCEDCGEQFHLPAPKYPPEQENDSQSALY